MLDIKAACNVLHIDQGDNDELIESLLDAIPNYIETTTGMSISAQYEEPLCDTVAGFLLTQWYYSDHADDQSLSRTIDSLLKVISVRARACNG